MILSRSSFGLLFAPLLALSMLEMTEGAAGPTTPGDQITFTTRDGHLFKDVSVVRTVGRKMEVMTPAGVKVLRFANLPDDMQARYFDASLRFPPKVGDTLDFKTQDGRAIKGGLSRVAPDGITIETADGFEKIAYSNLPSELASTFDYDADDAARYEAAERAAQQRANAARQAAARQAALARRPATPTPTPVPQSSSSGSSDIGGQGATLLGAPRLGGRGLSK